MIIIYNFITLCKYLINNTSVKYLEFEGNDDDNDDEDDEEPLCHCNLCYTFRNLIFFVTRRLK
jgi:hypothetical protein